jgi:hypothetical protein
MTYDATRAAVTRAAVLATLIKEVQAADKAVRAEVLAGLNPGDRLNGVLPGGQLAGRVRVDPGPRTAYVADEAAFTAWVAQHHPTEVETITVTRVRPAYRDKILATAPDAGFAVDPDTGECPPGVELRQGAPRVVVVTTAADRAAITAAWADGTLSLADLVQPALSAGEAA